MDKTTQEICWRKLPSSPTETSFLLIHEHGISPKSSKKDLLTSGPEVYYLDHWTCNPQQLAQLKLNDLRPTDHPGCNYGTLHPVGGQIWKWSNTLA